MKKVGGGGGSFTTARKKVVVELAMLLLVCFQIIRQKPSTGTTSNQEVRRNRFCWAAFSVGGYSARVLKALFSSSFLSVSHSSKNASSSIVWAVLSSTTVVVVHPISPSLLCVGSTRRIPVFSTSQEFVPKRPQHHLILRSSYRGSVESKREVINRLRG